MGAVMYSVVIPVYCNQESLPDLIDALKGIDAALDGNVEAVFVVDGSPDQSFPTLRQLLPHASFASQLVLLSRNFGSFAAIRCGLQAARGDYFAVLAADLQEPPELMVEFFHRLARDEADVMIGTRDSRDDPALTRFLSKTFWALYRRLINPEIPRGGVDVFACNREFRNQLLQLDEGHSSLIGLLFWLGFRRGSVSYKRRARKHGASAWTFRRKLTYMLDSIFAFSDLPVRLLLFVGVVGMSVSTLFGATVLVLRLFGQFDVPGYAATITAILFFGGLNALGLGVIGAYVWRAYANTQRRPLAVVMRSESFPAGGERA
jgi:glycosyltransferase involved in cell wall biosynthesis